VEEQKFVTPLSHLKALGVEVSLLIGLGKNVPLDEARGQIASGRILDYLHKDQGVDLNGWRKVQIDEINAEFQSMTTALDEKRQSRIDEDNNGLSFLMAYILEGISNRTRKTEPATVQNSGNVAPQQPHSPLTRSGSTIFPASVYDS
jgi:hypothetical protein